MEVGILALQGDVAEHASALRDVGVKPRPVRVPGDLTALAGIVLPGGESTTMSLLLGSSGLVGPLAEEIASGLPAFGTCAGMILLASSILDGRPDQLAFGAIDLSVRRNGFGRQLDSFERDIEVAGLGDGPVHAVFIRAPLVESVGAHVEVLGRLGDGGSPVLCREGGILVSAFHPELTPDRRLHRMFVSMIEEKGR
ncbi:MAG: pyridoxal 5'-phosphate synthase glutaminase subunit PdxT [Acidimicrobiales bacterium]